MPGNPLLTVGNTIQLDYPSVQARASNEKDEDLLDKYLAAKYLITSVRHVITQTTWNSHCEITKDSLPEELPEHFAANYSLEGL
jgi:hypothetical protein